MQISTEVMPHWGLDNKNYDEETQLDMQEISQCHDTEMAQKPAKVRSSRMYPSDTILSYFRLPVKILACRSPKS